MIGGYAIGEVPIGGLKTAGPVPGVATFRLLLKLQVQARTSSILSGIPASCPPINYALTPDGQLFMANGLMPMSKWDGVRFSAQTVGVKAPTAKPVLASSGSGTLSGTYSVYQRFVDFDGNVSNLSPVSNVLTITTNAKLTVSGLDLPTETKVARRQILRNTSGQTLDYFIEVDSTDLATTSFDLTMTDAQLNASIAVPLFDKIGGNTLANRFGIPPSNMSIVVAQQNRMLAFGDTPYTDGAAEVTNGSATIQGVGTNWTAALIGRDFYVEGEPLSYAISAVNAAAQTLTLAGPFLGATDLFAVYTVRAAPAQKNLVYFTEAGFYDAWPAVNALQVEETGDEMTAGISNESFVYIVQRRKTYRLSFLNDPSVDGGIFLAHRRGCVNQRSWVLVDGQVYALDQEGVYRSSGNQVEPLSNAIQDIFWLDRSDPNATRINWNDVCFFHAQHCREETTIRWYVTLSGRRIPRHALAYNYRQEQWWIEEGWGPMGGSATMLGAIQRPIVAGPFAKILAGGVGTTDGPDPFAGTTRGLATSSTLDSFTDTSAIFPTSYVVGYPVTIFDGTGKTQVRTVTAVSGHKISVDQPWTTALDTTSEYQLGAVNWKWRGGWYRWAHDETENVRRIETIFEPCTSDAQMDIRLYRDHAHEPLTWAMNYPFTKKEDTGIIIKKGSTDIVANLDFNKGFAQVRMDGHRDEYLQQADFVSLEMRGASAENPIRVYEVALEGAGQ